jgi:hypothetical protein
VPGQRRVVGYDRETQKSVYGPVLQAFGPGQQVRLPRSEVVRLRQLGFLIDPNRKLPDNVHNVTALAGGDMPGPVSGDGAIKMDASIAHTCALN